MESEGINTEEIRERYFGWLCDIVCRDEWPSVGAAEPLLRQMHRKIFRYEIAMDGNRADDGIQLRYLFLSENGYPYQAIAAFGDAECSVLEMLVALSVRCEEHIMENPEYGDRTDFWFWGMIENLGLMRFIGRFWDEGEVDDILERLLRHEYGPHGEGGLFLIPQCAEDLRKTEIWYQMNWYLCTLKG